MKVTSCQVHVLKEPIGKTRATCRCMLDDELQLTGIRIVLGMNGLFVSYPIDTSYKGEEYKAQFYPVTRELRDHIESVLLAQYLEQVQGDEGTRLDVYDFLLKQKWLSVKEREYVDMFVHSHGVSTTKVEKDIQSLTKDLKYLRKTKRLLSKGLGASIKDKLTERYGTKAPLMLDQDREQQAVAQCILKDLPL